MSEWISAKEAREITEGASLRKLVAAKKRIMQEIRNYAQNGHNYATIYMEYYNVSCLEDWCNIYNWLLNLGYEVEDYSSYKFNPNFYIKW